MHNRQPPQPQPQHRYQTPPRSYDPFSENGSPYDRLKQSRYVSIMPLPLPSSSSPIRTNIKFSYNQPTKFSLNLNEQNKSHNLDNYLRKLIRQQRDGLQKYCQQQSQTLMDEFKIRIVNLQKQTRKYIQGIEDRVIDKMRRDC